MKIDARTALVLRHPDKKRVLLLRRSSLKKLLPDLITGIGGKVEFERGEAEDIETSMWREFAEETKISRNIISKVDLVLTASYIKEETFFVLYWFIGDLKEEPKDLSCSEGTLEWFDTSQLPLQQFTDTAAVSIPFILNEIGSHIGYYARNEDGSLIFEHR